MLVARPLTEATSRPCLMRHTSLLSFLSNGDDGDCIGKGAEIFGLLSYTMVDCDIFGSGVVPGRWEGPAASSRDTRWRREEEDCKKEEDDCEWEVQSHVCGQAVWQDTYLCPVRKDATNPCPVRCTLSVWLIYLAQSKC